MDIKNEAKKTLDNVKDTVNETVHRTQAQAEQDLRDDMGDELSPGDKFRSVANQAKNTVQAGIDHAKKEVRKNT